MRQAVEGGKGVWVKNKSKHTKCLLQMCVSEFEWQDMGDAIKSLY